MTDDNIEHLDDDVMEQLKAQAGQRRKRAGIFTWHDRSAQGKGIAEAGLIDELLALLRAEGQADYRSLGPSDDEWPDAWLEKPDGQRIPCEVAELVDAKTLPDRAARPEIVKELAGRLQMILNRKGLRSLGGTTGTQSILVIHTDELYLDADTVAARLHKKVFKKPSTIQRAFLLLGYDPTKDGYRYFDLRLAA